MKRKKLKFTWSSKKVAGFLLVAAIVSIVLYPVRRLVVTWPAGQRHESFAIPPDGRFWIVYDSRQEGHDTTGEFQVCRDGKIRFRRMIYRKPFKEKRNFFMPGDMSEDMERIFVRQDLSPIPALHLVVSRKNNQALLLDGRTIKFSKLFPEGALLTIKTVPRPRVYGWLYGR